MTKKVIVIKEWEGLANKCSVELQFLCNIKLDTN